MSQAFNDNSLMATDLIDYLRGKYQIDEAAALAVAEERLNYNTLPLYLRILIGFGAINSGFLILGFLGAIGLLDEDSTLIFGIAMLAIAIVVHLASRHRNHDTVSYVVLQQLSFLGVFVGKILIVWGAAEIGKNVGAFVGILAFTLATYWVYDLYLDRLISCASTLISGLLLLYQEFNWNEQLVGIMTHSAVPLALAIYLHPRIKQAYNPLAIALIGFAAGNALYAMAVGEVGIRPWLDFFDISPVGNQEFRRAMDLTRPISSLLMSLITCGSLIGLVVWTCGGKNSFASRYVRATIVLTLLLGLANMTATMIGLIVIILGYACHDRLITLVGTLFLPITLAIAVHSLYMGLMATGILLVVISLVLLAGYFLFRYWSFEGQGESDNPELAGEATLNA
jgi:hypothetical protein